MDGSEESVERPPRMPARKYSLGGECVLEQFGVDLAGDRAEADLCGVRLLLRMVRV